MKLESKNIQRNKFYPSFSIVIEWENILFSEMWRAHNMLKQLCKQIVEMSPNFVGKPEIIIDYNPNHVVGKQIEQIIKRYLENCLSLIQFKILPAPGLDYTALKNF